MKKKKGQQPCDNTGNDEQERGVVELWDEWDPQKKSRAKNGKPLRKGVRKKRKVPKKA